MKTKFLTLLLFSSLIGIFCLSNSVLCQSKASEAKTKVGQVKTERALFGAGCFWGVEETFRQLPGVVSTAVGFAGGTVVNPSYKRVCVGDTMHAEVVEIIYDPKKITYNELLKTFFSSHDPSSVNRQGFDFGEQYRSVIFYTSPEQQKEAETFKEEWQKTHNKKAATIIEAAKPFYKAEEYHQHYLEKRGFKVCH
jgi:peptide-methionine (S)-S-oxide reductase